jgi:xylulokinase
MTVLLGIDVGTTNWKAGLFTENGKLIGQKSTPTVTHHDGHGSFYDPEEMWSCLCDLTRGLLSEYPDAQVASVSVTSLAESGIALGADGTPVDNSIAWFDPRSREQAQRVVEKMGQERLFAIAGLDPNPIFSLFKMQWMREHAPERFSRMKKWIWVGDYVNYRFTGEIVTDFSLASRAMLFDIHAGVWSQEILNAVDLDPNLLPPVVSTGTVLGAVTRRAANESGIPEGTPVIVGGHDHYCAFVAAGALANEVTLDSSGTAESIVKLLPKDADPPTVFEGLRVGFFLDPERYATMAGVLAAGASVDWAVTTVWKNGENAGNISARDYDEAMDAARQIDAGSGGVLYVPHLRGAGAPYWDPQSRGAFVGLRSDHTRGHLMRAVIEGLSFELRVLLQAVDNVFGTTTTLNTVGGGARNEFWQQVKADVTGVTINCPDVEDATVQGAALIGGVGVGIFENLKDASKTVFRLRKRFEPRPEYVERYNEIFEDYVQVYPALRDLNISLTDRVGRA